MTAQDKAKLAEQKKDQGPAAPGTASRIRATRRCRICLRPVSKPHAEACQNFRRLP